MRIYYTIHYIDVNEYQITGYDSKYWRDEHISSSNYTFPIYARDKRVQKAIRESKYPVWSNEELYYDAVCITDISASEARHEYDERDWS